jgi:hypothetical protein
MIQIERKSQNVKRLTQLQVRICAIYRKRTPVVLSRLADELIDSTSGVRLVEEVQGHGMGRNHNAPGLGYSRFVLLRFLADARR